MVEKTKKQNKWAKPVIWAALAFPSAVLFLNDFEYTIVDFSIHPIFCVLLSVGAVWLFNENFISKDLVEPKTADVGPKIPLSEQPRFGKNELNLGSGEFGPSNDYQRRPRY